MDTNIIRNNNVFIVGGERITIGIEYESSRDNNGVQIVQKYHVFDSQNNDITDRFTQEQIRDIIASAPVEEKENGDGKKANKNAASGIAEETPVEDAGANNGTAQKVGNAGTTSTPDNAEVRGNASGITATLSAIASETAKKEKGEGNKDVSGTETTPVTEKKADSGTAIQTAEISTTTNAAVKETQTDAPYEARTAAKQEVPSAESPNAVTTIRPTTAADTPVPYGERTKTTPSAEQNNQGNATVVQATTANQTVASAEMPNTGTATSRPMNADVAEAMRAALTSSSPTQNANAASNVTTPTVGISTTTSNAVIQNGVSATVSPVANAGSIAQPTQTVSNPNVVAAMAAAQASNGGSGTPPRAINAQSNAQQTNVPQTSAGGGGNNGGNNGGQPPNIPPNQPPNMNASPFNNGGGSGNGGNSGGQVNPNQQGGQSNSPASQLVAALNRANNSQKDLKDAIQKLVDQYDKAKEEKDKKDGDSEQGKLIRSLFGLVTSAMARQTVETAWNIGRDPTKDNFYRDTARDTTTGALDWAGKGASAGLLIGGPIGAVVGGVGGAGLGAWNAWQKKHNERFGQEKSDEFRLEWNQRDSMYNQNYDIGDRFMRMGMKWMSAEDRQKTLMARVRWLRTGNVEETESGYINNGEGYTPPQESKPVGKTVAENVSGWTQADAEDANERMSDAARKASEMLGSAVEDGASSAKDDVKRKVVEAGEKVAAIAAKASEEADKQSEQPKQKAKQKDTPVTVGTRTKPNRRGNGSDIRSFYNGDTRFKNARKVGDGDIRSFYNGDTRFKNARKVGDGDIRSFYNGDTRFKNARKVGDGDIRSFYNGDTRFKNARRLEAPKTVDRSKRSASKSSSYSGGRGIIGFSVPEKTQTRYFGNPDQNPNKTPPKMTTHVFGNAPGYGGANAVKHPDNSLSDLGAELYKTQYAKNNKALIEAQKKGNDGAKYEGSTKTREMYFGDEKARPERLKPKSVRQRAKDMIKSVDRYQKAQQEREKKRGREAYENKNSKRLQDSTRTIKSGTNAYEEFMDGQRKRLGMTPKSKPDLSDTGKTLPASKWAKPKAKATPIKTTRKRTYNNLPMDESKGIQQNRYGENKIDRQNRAIEEFDKKSKEGYIGIDQRDDFLKSTIGNQDDRRKRIEARTNADREKANALEAEAMTTTWQARLDTLQMPSTRNLVDAYQAKGMSMGKSIDAGSVQDNIYGEMQRVRDILLRIQKKFEKKGDDYSIKASTVNINVDRMSA